MGTVKGVPGVSAARFSLPARYRLVGHIANGGMAGVWEGTRSLDVNPKAPGPERQRFIERIELQPIDPQTNGPQLLYGLRYHTHIVKPGEIETYHDQVGYWLWEPATGMLIQTLATHVELVKRVQISLRGRRDDVGVGPRTVDDPSRAR